MAEFDDILNAALEGYRTGLSGESHPLFTIGIDASKFKYERVEDVFHSNPDKYTVNLTDHIRKITQYLGYYLYRKKEGKDIKLDIAVVGPTGSGKTQFIETFLKAVDKLKEKDLKGELSKLETKKVNMKVILHQKDDEELEETFYELASSEIVIIDDMWYHQNPKGYLKNLFESMDSGMVITTWRPVHYMEFLDEWKNIVFTELEKAHVERQEEIYISSLEERFENELFDKLWDFVNAKSDAEKFKESLRELFSLSFKSFEGIPGLVIKNYITYIRDNIEKVRRYLKEENILKNKEKILNDFKEIGFLTMDDIISIMEGTSKIGYKIIKEIILSRDDRGIAPTDIIPHIFENIPEDNINLRRKKAPTVAHHISKLKSMGLLHDTREGKNIFYKFKPEVEPLLELYFQNIGWEVFR